MSAMISTAIVLRLCKIVEGIKLVPQLTTNLWSGSEMYPIFQVRILIFTMASTYPYIFPMQEIHVSRVSNSFVVDH